MSFYKPNPPAMMITDIDAPLSLEDEVLQLALASALHERIGRIGQWVNRGDIEVAPYVDDANVVIHCGDDITWREPKEDFPSANLIAQIALALHTGHRGPRTNIANYHPNDPLSYLPGHIAVPSKASQYLHQWSLIEEFAYAKVAALTVPVTKAKKKLQVVP